MRNLNRLALGCVLTIVGTSCPPITGWAQSNAVDITPVMQQSPMWCWLATGEMIFEYYNVPAIAQNFQCGEARGAGATPTGQLGQFAFVGPCWLNCWNCARLGAGTIIGLYSLITQYPMIASRTVGSDVSLSARIRYGPLTMDELKGEIDAGRPVAAGISPGSGFLPPGVSEHAVLIVGYDLASSSVTVIDPYPYQLTNLTPSYVQFGGHASAPGTFVVPYATLVGPIKWGNTVFDIRAH